MIFYLCWGISCCGKKEEDGLRPSLQGRSSNGFLIFFLQTFAKTDLPKQHRMVNEGDMMTMDHNPERYVSLSFLFLLLGSFDVFSGFAIAGELEPSELPLVDCGSGFSLWEGRSSVPEVKDA